MSSTPEAIVVIPDDDVQQSDGNQGETKHPEVFVQTDPQTSSDLSPRKGVGGAEWHFTPPNEGPLGSFLHPVYLFLSGAIIMVLVYLFMPMRWILLPCVSACCCLGHGGHGQSNPFS